MDEWFYAQGREKCGPISGQQLKDFLRTGVVTPGTLVWSKALTEWQPAIQVPGLMEGGAPAEETGVPAVSGLPWETMGGELAPSGAAVAPEPTAVPRTNLMPGASPEMDAFDAAVEKAEKAASVRLEGDGSAVTLEFSKKRKKPKHKRATTKIKTFVVRVAALIIAVGILGGGGYLGAQYMGMFEEPVPARLRYLPDNPDFVFTMNVPKAMSVAQAMGANSSQILNAASITGMEFDAGAIQDVTIAGNVKEANWVVVATLSKEIDIETLFPGGTVPDTLRVGGEKIYFNKEMASFGMNFGFMTPSKSVLVVAPVGTLKAVMKRRGAPLLAKGFAPLLDQKNSVAWMAGAADIDALWRLAEKGLPVDLTEDQRWLAQSISSLSFHFSGTSEYDFELQAQAKKAGDAPLIAKKVEAVMLEQRSQVLEMLHTFGQLVDENTKTPLDNIKIVAGDDGIVTIRQHIDKKMLEIGSEQLAAAGLAQP